MELIDGPIGNSNAIVILSTETEETIKQNAGTQSWKLDKKHVEHCSHVLICRKRNDPQWSRGTGTNGTAFMIGRITGLSRSKDKDYPDRWKIEFREFSTIDIPNLWDGGRNPVRYTTLQKLGINPDAFEFSELPKPKEIYGYWGSGQFDVANQTPEANRLTIEEAKEGLAATFGVEPEAIEIIIRG